MHTLTVLLALLPAWSCASNVARVSDVDYYIPSKVELEYGFDTKEPFPITFVNLPHQTINAVWLNHTISEFLTKDDVYTPGFSAAFFLRGSQNSTLSEDAELLLKALGTTHVVVDNSACNTTVPDGPYFASSSGLHQAWRLYDDYTDSFVSSCVRSTDKVDSFEILQAHGSDSFGALSIAVPSRLYFTPTMEKPLAGYRIAVKDQYHIKGLITTFGSRSYAATYPPANETSASIQTLIDMGAIIVGKTKLSVYANAWFTISQWSDYSLPFNPRGDGYQIPGASSAGSGASIAAYDWLDNAIGEDTGGSMRFPSAMNGVYGMRTSINSTNNTATPFGPFDVVGHFARDVDSLNTLGALMYTEPGFKNFTTFPKKIIYPREYWANISDSYIAPCEEYVRHLEAFLGVNRTILDSNTLWLEYSNQNRSIADYFANVVPYVSGTNTFSKDFKKDHFEKFGRYPYVTLDGEGDPSFTPQNPTLGDIGFALREEFQRFYRKYYLTENSQTCSDAIVVFPFNGNGGIPWYRDTNIGYTPAGYAPALPGYISWNLLSVMNGSPEIVVPVGSKKFHSRVTLVEEELPVALEIQGAYGCDLMLMNLVREVAYSGALPTGVKTGRTLK